MRNGFLAFYYNLIWTFGIHERKFEIKRLGLEGRWAVPKGFVLIYKMTARCTFEKIYRFNKKV